MSQRIDTEGLPEPSPHVDVERYLFRVCQLLGQVSRQLDDLLAQGQAPAPAIPSAPDAEVELVTEPATPKPPAKKAVPRVKKTA